jgi:hypothetical protein
MDNQTGADNQREFLGITQNECKFQGKVVGDPVIHGDNYAFMQIKTSISEVGVSGQWTDTIIQIPVLTMDPKKVAVIQKYVQDGRELLLDCFYKPWVQEGVAQHAFMIKKMTLGRKKWIPKEEYNQGTPTPSLPVQ